MTHIKVSFNDVQAFLTKIAAMWTTAMSVTFLVSSMFLFDKMMKSQAKFIVRQREPNIEKKPIQEKEATKKVVSQMYDRISFVNIYSLFDEVQQLRTLVVQQQAQIE